ncbi:peptidoglycan-binding domain-containing protein [Deinococcus peraridilitoris]|uniref:Putative peptidoglycan-binding domain-containing protein n=1 Tax=Deinococcus peraridilitoris (strain DSM 19664 / LMG 22246 / CIP 109416 / KR-200) TaxID=937777 RepID=L0A3V1_DEIPD|nr:peptidoglycan-binding domain-containing protein [Deinococcus peraridilitoris]AFZ67685.1 putative peptidoglycan-binding domain-containing protein [Deinococcus peraridilitoris DSM 19664]
MITLPSILRALLLTALTSFTGALAAATPAQVEGAAVAAARAVDGTIVACPETFRNFTESRRCVRVPGEPEEIKARLNRSLGAALVSAWRAQSNPIYSYNYLRSAGEFVGIVAGPAARDGKSTLLVFDAVPDRADLRRDEESVRIVPQPREESQASTPAPGTVTPSASPSGSSPAQPGASTGAANRETPGAAAGAGTVPAARAASPRLTFARPLVLREPRLNGEDVRAVQNRLMDVAGMARGAGGDGWYGPVTSATVRAFQAANALPVTGMVDRTTWERLFSPEARPFDPNAVRARP